MMFSPFLMPKVSVSDPELTIAMPPTSLQVPAWTFTHNFEAYLPKRHHPLSDAIALGEVILL